MQSSENTLFHAAAAEGQSIFVATGDVGTAASKLGSCLVPPKPASANIEENAGSPHVTAVGASMFQATYDSNGNVTSTLANTKQTPWDFSRKSPKLTILQAFGATTGGYSKIFPLPIWQKGVAGIAGKFRAVPDLVLGGGNLGGQETISEKGNTLKFTGSIAPSPNFWECFDAGLANGGAALGYECATTGGTSIVPPQYAGLLAIIVQKSAKRQGLINPQLYAMAQANLKNPAAVGLVDITTGNDAYPPVAGKAAKKNYDLASGWGSVDMTNFVNSFISFVPPPPKIKK
jgi:subtilase family serine protease